jgi:hypothetical protein
VKAFIKDFFIYKVNMLVWEVENILKRIEEVFSDLVLTYEKQDCLTVFNQ